MRRSQVLQEASYRKAVSLLLRIYEILGGVKTRGYVQAVVLHELYALLAEAIEALIDVEPAWLANDVKARLKRAGFFN